jgi:hypothetical protein
VKVNRVVVDHDDGTVSEEQRWSSRSGISDLRAAGTGLCMGADSSAAPGPCNSDAVR